MELVLERLDRDTWRPIDPGLVLAQGDRVRFKFRTNFDGYPLRHEPEHQRNLRAALPSRGNRPGQPHLRLDVNIRCPPPAPPSASPDPPATRWSTGWSPPRRLTDPAPRFHLPPAAKAPPPTLIPRCDDTILKSRGDCVDSSAGPKLVPRGEVPQNLASRHRTRTARPPLPAPEKHRGNLIPRAPDRPGDLRIPPGPQVTHPCDLSARTRCHASWSVNFLVAQAFSLPSERTRHLALSPAALRFSALRAPRQIHSLHLSSS